MTEYKHFTVRKNHGIVEEIESQDGHNDAKRLQNWANNKASKNLKESLKDFIREEIKKISINQRTGELEY